MKKKVTVIRDSCFDLNKLQDEFKQQGKVSNRVFKIMNQADDSPTHGDPCSTDCHCPNDCNCPSASYR